MSREIKFQILWVKNNIDFTKSIEKHYTTLERLTNGTDQFPYCDVEIIAKRQYTGIKDENGVEIYDGDIVSFADEFGITRDSLVEWGDCSFLIKVGVSYELLIDYAGCDDFFVIGNSHENPELL